MNSQLLHIAANNPELAAHGWHNTQYGALDKHEFERSKQQMLTPEFERQVETARSYIRTHGCGRHDSYGLKHYAERWGCENGLECYVPNGALIVAAILEGYHLRREKNSPNCTFKKPRRA